MAERLSISVIITTYAIARLGNVLELLDSLAAQTYPAIEVIVVTEASVELRDGIADRLRERNRNNFRQLSNDGPRGASAARNVGIKAAKGDIIAFVDDDTLVPPEWVAAIAETFRDDSVIGVTGPSSPIWPDGKEAAWLPKELYWVIGCTDWFEPGGITEVRNVWLQNASFRREAFRAAGLLDVGLGPRDSELGFKGNEMKRGVVSEEVEFSLRVRRETQKRVVFNPDVKACHRVGAERLALGYILRWARWMGISKYELKRWYPESGGGNLHPEQQLLKSILTRLIPGTIAMFFYRPLLAWRRLLVTVTVLTFTALGYLSGSLKGRHTTLLERKAGDHETR